MIRLIIAVVLGILFAVFATQNTSLVTVNVFQYSSSQTPVYVVVLVSVVLGLLISGIAALARSISSGFRLRAKNRKLSDYEKQVADLTREVHRLELENTRLKAEYGESDEADDGNSI